MIVFAGVSCKAPQGSLPSAPAPSQTAATRELTDDLSRKVTLPQTVNRVVTLAPNLTEIVYAVDGGDKLVGDTTYCNYPDAAKAVQKVGDTINPNLEAIVALKPDVVFVSTASQIETFTKRLEEQKIAVFVTDAKDLEGVYRGIETIGDILGKKEKAGELVAAMKNRVAAVEARTENATPYRVFVQVSEEPLFTAGGTSFITDLIERAGGFSVTANIKEPYPRLSEETALALQPDAIILSGMVGGDQKPNSVFARSPAVKNKRVFQIDGDLLTRPGPRSVDVLEQIAEKLHGSEVK
jgi:iron complex transport system substrate-binding protein